METNWKKKLHRNVGYSINVRLYKSDNINVWLKLALSLSIVPAFITRARKMEDRLQFISHIQDEVFSKHNFCVSRCRHETKIGHYHILSIIGTPDENKTGLYFSRYEHVYLSNAIQTSSDCGWIFTRLLYSCGLNIIHSCSEFHTTTQTCNAMLTVRWYHR